MLSSDGEALLFLTELGDVDGGRDDQSDISPAATASFLATVLGLFCDKSLILDTLELDFEARPSLIFLTRSLNGPITMALFGLSPEALSMSVAGAELLECSSLLALDGDAGGEWGTKVGELFAASIIEVSEESIKKRWLGFGTVIHF